MIDLRYLKKLVELLDGSTVDSIEISSDKGMKIRISKTPQHRGGIATPAAPEAKPKLLEVKSPMVGTFYRSPEPGAASYVSEGSRISKGEILCIIEAMKIMNEIESEYA